MARSLMTSEGLPITECERMCEHFHQMACGKTTFAPKHDAHRICSSPLDKLMFLAGRIQVFESDDEDLKECFIGLKELLTFRIRLPVIRPDELLADIKHLHVRHHPHEGNTNWTDNPDGVELLEHIYGEYLIFAQRYIESMELDVEMNEEEDFSKWEWNKPHPDTEG